MSQYPSPYQSPQPSGYSYPYSAPPDLGRHARYAGMLMIILGILGTLGAGCIATFGLRYSDLSNLTPEEVELLDRVLEPARRNDPNLDTQGTIKAAVILLTVIAAVPAFLIVLTGLFVRRGKMAAIIIGIILTAGLLLLMLLWLVQSLFVVASNPQAAIGLCMVVIPLGLLSLQMFWLAKAVMNVGPLKALSEQQQAYQWQMAQHAAQQQQYYQQMYQQQGYNYPPQAPPPPPPGQQGSGDNKT